MAPLKPEWCARAPVNAVNKSFECRSRSRPASKRRTATSPKLKAWSTAGAPRRRTRAAQGVAPADAGRQAGPAQREPSRRTARTPGQVRAGAADAPPVQALRSVSRTRARSAPSHKSGAEAAVRQRGARRWGRLRLVARQPGPARPRRKGLIVGPVAGVRVWRRVGHDGR